MDTSQVMIFMDKSHLLSLLEKCFYATIKINIAVMNGNINDKNQTPLIPNGKRVIFCNGSNKFYEIVDLNNGMDEFIVCIGLNPKRIDPNAMDSSNVKLVKYCANQGYGGYLLLNLYSYRTDNANDLSIHIINHHNKIDDMRTVIADFIKRINNKIVLFYGHQGIKFVDNNLKNAFGKVNPKQVYYSAEANGDFCHISSIKFNGIRQKNSINLW